MKSSQLLYLCTTKLKKNLPIGPKRLAIRPLAATTDWYFKA